MSLWHYTVLVSDMAFMNMKLNNYIVGDLKSTLMPRLHAELAASSEPSMMLDYSRGGRYAPQGLSIKPIE